MATDELAGTAISQDDDEWLRIIGGFLRGLWWRSGDRLSSPNPIRDDDAAVIADIVRGIDIDSGFDDVLEIGTGRIDRIFVLMPTHAGEVHPVGDDTTGVLAVTRTRRAVRGSI